MKYDLLDVVGGNALGWYVLIFPCAGISLTSFNVTFGLNLLEIDPILESNYSSEMALAY